MSDETRKPEPEPDVPEEHEDTAQKITPFKIINRGDDSIDDENDVVFADFSPRVVPADTPDEIVQPAPKASSAPAPAPSSDSTQTTSPQLSGPDALAPAAGGAGQDNPSESSSPTSSSEQNPG